MTTPDKLSRERLEYLRMGDRGRQHMWTIACGPQEPIPEDARSMATEILELREEVERLRRSQMHVRSIAPWPTVEVSSINEVLVGDPSTPSTATAQALSDPHLESLRHRVEATEAGLAYVRGRLNI